MENQGWEFQVQGPARAKVKPPCARMGVGVAGKGQGQSLVSYGEGGERCDGRAVPGARVLFSDHLPRRDILLPKYPASDHGLFQMPRLLACGLLWILNSLLSTGKVQTHRKRIFSIFSEEVEVGQTCCSFPHFTEGGSGVGSGVECAHRATTPGWRM